MKLHDLGCGFDPLGLFEPDGFPQLLKRHIFRSRLFFSCKAERLLEIEGNVIDIKMSLAEARLGFISFMNDPVEEFQV